MADRQLRIIIQAVDKASGALSKINNSTKKLGDGMSRLGKSWSRNVSLPLLGVGIAALKAASDMDTAMRNIQSITGQTDAEIAALSGRLSELSTSMETGAFSAVNYAEAMYQVESAGFAGAEGELLLAEASRAAQAGIADLTPTVDALTGTLNAYRMEADQAEHISDLFFVAIKRGKTTMNELAAAMPGVTPLAASLNIEVSELTAAFTTMTKQGTDTVNAGTQIRAVMAELTNGTTELTEAANQLGYADARALVEQRGLIGAMQELERYAQQAGIPVDALFGNIRAKMGVLQITGANARSLAEDFAAMGDAAGATDAAFQEQAKSFEFLFKKTKAELTQTLKEIGEILMPVARDIMNAIRGIMDAFQALPDPVKKAIVTFLAVTAALGPILFIGGKILSTWSMVGKLFTMLPGVMTLLSGAVSMLGAALTFLLSPLGLIIIAGVAIGAALYLLYKNWDDVTNLLGGVWDRFKQGLTNWQNMIANGFEVVKKAWSNFKDQFKEGLDIIWKGIEGFFSGLFKLLQTIGGNVAGFIGDTIKAVGQLISLAFNSLLDAIGRFINDAIKAAVELARGVVDAVEDFLGIGSPSKVFAQIGENMGLSQAAGYAKGLRAGMQQVGGIYGAMQSSASGASSHAASIARAMQTYGITDAGKQRDLLRAINPEDSFKSWDFISKHNVKPGSRDQSAMMAITAIFGQMQKSGVMIGQSLITGIEQALGIASPSKAMMKVGREMMTGLSHGMGVNKPGHTPDRGFVPTPTMGGGGNVYIENLTVPEGTPRRQVDYITREIATRKKRRLGV